MAAKKQTYIINSKIDLDKLPRKEFGLIPSAARPRVSLEILAFDSAKRLHYEKTLLRYYSDCGCSGGTAAVFVFLVAYPLLIFLSGQFQPSWALLWKGLILLFMCAAIGKILGLLRARYRIRSTIGDIKKICELQDGR